MKAILLFGIFCLIGQTIAAPSSYGLENDVKDFIRLWPQKEMNVVTSDYLENDKDLQGTLQYLRSKEFTAIWKQITTNNEFRDLVNYLEDAGLHVIELLDDIANGFDLPPYPLEMYSATFRKGGLNGLFDDVMAVLPKKELEALFREKLQTSPAVKELYDKLTGTDFQRVLNNFNNSKEITSALMNLEEHGVDIYKCIEYCKALYGWN